MIKRKAVILIALVCSTVFLLLCSNLEYGGANLAKFKSYAELKEFLQKSTKNYQPFCGSTDLLPLFAFTESIGYSKTNIQVEGVDEADIVKTDGECLYIISCQNIVIAKAHPPEEAVVLSRISLNGTLKQVFIKNNKLAVFYEEGCWDEAKTLIHIYDVACKELPKFESEIKIEGRYFNSRMIDDHIYAIVMYAATIIDDEVRTPRICINSEWKEIQATEIYYSQIADYSYAFAVIAAINVYTAGRKLTYEPLLICATSNMYVSLNNIYLATPAGAGTTVYRIRIDKGEIAFVADGHVTGRVLNQFSMDEHNGFFRIATTYAGRNNLYVLDMDLEIVSSLEDIAPTERIYSARFMGDICYLVTFKKVDPFFVIDLSDPYKPRILGELKISGYSDYLHPYDKNHVIGVGKETVPAEKEDFSWYQGVKISLFDVTDVCNPKEIAKYVIGDRGTDSPVLSDHKAFLFDRENGLLVIPVLVADIDESAYPYGFPPYVVGDPVWQGAYVFKLSLELEEKIILKSKITHIKGGDVLNSTYHINRALFIDDALYTISERMIKINSLSSLNEIKELYIGG